MTKLTRDALASMVFQPVEEKDVSRPEPLPAVKDLGIRGLSILCERLGVIEMTPNEINYGINLQDADDDRFFNLTMIFQAMIVRLDRSDHDLRVTFDAISAMHRDMAHMFERVVGSPYIRPET